MSSLSPPAAATGPAATDEEAHTVWLYQAQKKIYPRTVNGGFVPWRWAFVWLTQLAFYGTHWLMCNKRQAVLGGRRCHIFGLVLCPQDFIYRRALLIISAYALFLFTAVGNLLGAALRLRHLRQRRIHA
jgi:hypothetical protein